VDQTTEKTSLNTEGKNGYGRKVEGIVREVHGIYQGRLSFGKTIKDV
jgi:hypothetical protein